MRAGRMAGEKFGDTDDDIEREHEDCFFKILQCELINMAANQG